MIINYVRSKYPRGLCMDNAGDGSGGGSGDSGASGDAGKAGGDTVSKADYEKAIGDLDKANKELEDTRSEVYTPEYLDYIAEGERGRKKVDVKPSGEGEADLEKMSKKELVDHLNKQHKEDLAASIKEVKDEMSSNSKAVQKQKVSDFADAHDDFDKYRPLMHGLSVDPKNVNKSLAELYKMAKEHAKGFGPTDTDKKKSRRSGGEKPDGSNSGTFQEKKNYTPEEAAREAFNEVCPDGLPAE